MKKYFLFFVFFIFVSCLFSAKAFSIDIGEDIFNYSKITDSDIKDKSQLIVWIQDLHNDYATQNNIYNVLSILAQNKDINNIYMEGVNNNEVLDTSLISSIPNNDIKNKTIQNLFKEGILSAGEYFSLNTNNKVYGIEDAKIYSQNLKILEKINNTKELNNYVTSKISSFVQDLKKSYILNGITALQNKDISSLSLEDSFPNLQKQQNILKKADDINYYTLNKELQQILSELQKNIPSKQYETINKYLKSNNSYGYVKFYDCVKNNLEKYPNLNLFLQSNADLFAINPIQLLKETNEIKKQLLEDINLNISETEMLDLEYYSKAISNLVNTTISAEQYNQIKQNKDYISYIFKKYLPLNLSKFALMYLNDKDFFTFYENNLYRNKIFVKNILETAENDNNKFNVLIAGGFHNEITDELKKQNKSYIVLTPNTTNSAFNKLFISAFNNGNQEQATAAFFEIVKQWGVFFPNAQSFQNEINKWIKSTPELKDYKVQVSLNNNVYDITVNYKGFSKTMSFSLSDTKQETASKQVHYSKYLANYTLKRFSDLASSTRFFGNNTKVVVSNDNSLIDSSLLLPIKINTNDGITTISVNKSFLNAISVESDNLIKTIVQLLFLYSNYDENIDTFQQFITDNSQEINKIYNITKNLSAKKSFFDKVKIFSLSLFNFQTENEEIIDTKKDTDLSADEQAMTEALKQAELARQSRSYLKTFTQPPVGGYIVDENGISGRNFNRTDSLLHAETLTIIDYFRNYINANKQNIDPATYDLVNTLLNDLIENAKQLNSKFFYNNPMIFKLLGIEMEYSGNKRDNNELFKETNLVLKFINKELGNPIGTCKLYCTLSPCNKCVGTMCTLKIDSLIYASRPANSFHKSLHLLNENGISVTETVLEKEADKYIKNYSRLNASKIGTKIASFIQATRRIATNLFNRINEFAYEAMYNDLSKLIKLRLEKTIVDLQQNIDWNNINKTTDLSAVELLLKQLNIWNDPIKRAGMIYILRNNIKPFKENGCIYFQTDDGVKLDFFINENTEVVVSDKYIERMEKLAKTRNIADMDDNLASRNESFTNEMANILNNMLLYGVGSPVIVTGNTLEQTKDKRFKSLGVTTPKLISKFFTTHGARLYENTNNPDADTDDTFTENVEYKTDISKTYLGEDVLKELDSIFKPYKDMWYQQFIQFKKHIKKLEQEKGKNKITYEDIIKPYLYSFSFSKLLNILKDKYYYKGKSFYINENLIDFWKELDNQEAKDESKYIYKYHLKDLPEVDIIEALEAMSILEMARIYLSQEAADNEERISLLKGLEEETDPKYYDYDADDTRYIISPMRPNNIRAVFAQHFEPTIKKRFKDLEIKSAGQTTININKVNVSKTVPIKDYIMDRENISADQIIYTGDDFDRINNGGVDYPVFELQQQPGYEGMFVVSTAYSKVDGLDSLPCLIDIEGFSSESSVTANIDRNLKLQGMILHAIENRVGNILMGTNEDIDNIPVAQELKSEILGPQIEVIDVNNFNTKETESLLKAG